MDTKKIDLIWVISLFVIGSATMILIGDNILGIGLTDIVVRMCGVIDLVTLPVFTFSTVKKVRNRK